MSKIRLLIVLVTVVKCALAVDDTPPTVYQPTYIYGATPGGVYMGDPYDPYDGMYMPNGEPMHEFNPQSGQPEQEFQYIQGQEQLMEDHSKTALRQYNQEQKIGNTLVSDYRQQIDAQTHESAPQPIVLPSM